MTDSSDPAADAVAALVAALLGPAPVGAGKADRRTTRGLARRQALEAARVSGCTCNPDITYHQTDPEGWPIASITVAHDDWCPLVDHGSQVLAYHQATPHPRRPGRNASCPCGSGDKYKRCHGG